MLVNGCDEDYSEIASMIIAPSIFIVVFEGDSIFSKLPQRRTKTSPAFDALLAIGPHPFASDTLLYDIHQQKWSPAKSMLKTLMEIEVLQRKPFKNS